MQFGRRALISGFMRILFVTSNRVGDAVLSTVVLRTLIHRYPGARITIACGPAAVSLFRGVPGLHRILPMAKQRSGGHWLALWLATVTTSWDMIVDLRASGLAWLLPAKKRRIYQPTKSYIHRVESLGRFIEANVGPKIWLTPEAEAAASRLLPLGGSAPLALGPTANWIGKQWPIERFIELAERLTAPGVPFADAPILVLGGPGERAAAQPLLDRLPAGRCVDLVGTVDLLTAAACLARARLYIGNDSGLMHLAAAAGAPTLGLFGPSQEMHYAPYGRFTATVRGEPYDVLFDRAQHDRVQKPPVKVSYMGSITVDAVHDTALDLLMRSQDVPAAPSHVPA